MTIIFVRTLGAKLGALFLLLALSAVGLCALVIVNLVTVRTDVRQFVEETREARLAHDLRWTVDELIQRAATEIEGPAGVSSVLGEVRRILNEFIEGPNGHDPSREEHQKTESSIETELDGALDLLDRLDDGRDADPAQVTELLTRIQTLIAELEMETETESARVTADLERRLRGLTVVMLVTVLASFAVLTMLFMIVKRDIVEPIRELSDGTRLFGEGQLDHRIEVHSNDEIGELADDFNQMASRLDDARSELENRVRERTRQLIQATRLADLGTFAAGVAHEVNTPLASIAMSAEGMERRLESGQLEREEQLDYLKTIAREAYRAHEITTRLLAFAREEPGPVAEVRVQDAVSEVARLLHHQMASRGIELHQEVEESTPPIIGNESELKQVVLNILKNAMDASPDHGIIRVRLGSSNNEVRLVVEDEGPGIPEEDLKRIFDPFFTTKKAGEGTGLGLALVFRIVEGYGGRIWAATRSGGKGAEIVIDFPRAGADPGVSQ